MTRPLRVEFPKAVYHVTSRGDGDIHLLELCWYVVLNPVRARLVEKVGEWPWSSYRATAGHRSPPAWLTVEWLLAQFDPATQRAIRVYRRFVAEGMEEAPWQALTGQIDWGG